MAFWAQALVINDVVTREAMLFAAIGFLIGGIDDLVIDALFFWRLWRRRRWPGPRFTMADFLAQPARGRLAVFIPAWDEAAVIAPMLAACLERFIHPDYRLYVGAYPNDPATIAEVRALAARDPRVRLVVGAAPGPTTKADCLNTLWRAHESDGWGARAIVLHDAEDLVHPAELMIFDSLIGRFAAVQLPVLPLVDPAARLVSGHYADEFAEAHAKQLVVREAVGAGLPLAGVGCAIDHAVLARIAAARGGLPFDAASLTEDYELGLAIAARGGRGVMVRVPEAPGGAVVAVRAYFPSSLAAAVRQKARWMIGIALAGWDRVGWARWSDWREHWMRMRDRRAPLAVLVLAAAYLALVGWALGRIGHAVIGAPPPPLGLPAPLLLANAVLLGWRLAMRAGFTGAAYGWREALWSLPRALVGNLIALLAARRAVTRYLAMLAGARPRWDKTAHVFPDATP